MYRCLNCETPHDSQEGANECCACERCIELESRIENANQAASETHPNWESHCRAILAALGENYGEGEPRYNKNA